VSEEDQRKRADERFQEALARDGGRDPREYYRERLRQLRESDESAFRRALEHYEKRLVPAVARADTDPLAEWLDYGRVLAELTSPGRTMSIDPSGRAHPYARPVAPDRLVLHLPTSAREPAILVGLPTALSPAQRATYALLVKGEKS
jgi:hypothetical protein